MNGVQLIEGASQDYTLSPSTNTVTLASNAVNGDVVKVVVFKMYNIYCFFVCLFASDVIQGRSSHSSALLGEYMSVFGGYSFNTEPFDDLIR